MLNIKKCQITLKVKKMFKKTLKMKGNTILLHADTEVQNGTGKCNG